MTTVIFPQHDPHERQESLYWPDRKSRFHRYGDLDPMPMVDRLLTEIDENPNCIIWG